jgi:hypothetical protein
MLPDTPLTEPVRRVYDHEVQVANDRRADMTRIVFLDRGTMGPLKQPVRPAFAHEWVENSAECPASALGIAPRM